MPPEPTPPPAEAPCAGCVALRTEREEARDALEADRSTVAKGVTGIDRAIRLRSWLREGRGSYQYDDDRWYAEFGAAIDEIRAALKPLRVVASNWAHCSTTDADVARGRGLITRLHAAEASEARLREALEEIAHKPFWHAEATHSEVLDAITEYARAALAEARRGEGRFPGKTATVRARNALTALYLELSPDIAADVRTHVEEAFAEIATEAAREALEQAAQVVEAFDDDARDRRLLLAAERIRALPPAAPASPGADVTVQDATESAAALIANNHVVVANLVAADLVLREMAGMDPEVMNRVCKGLASRLTAWLAADRAARRGEGGA